MKTLLSSHPAHRLLAAAALASSCHPTAEEAPQAELVDVKAKATPGTCAQKTGRLAQLWEGLPWARFAVSLPVTTEQQMKSRDPEASALIASLAHRYEQVAILDARSGDCGANQEADRATDKPCQGSATLAQGIADDIERFYPNVKVYLGHRYDEGGWQTLEPKLSARASGLALTQGTDIFYVVGSRQSDAVQKFYAAGAYLNKRLDRNSLAYVINSYTVEENQTFSLNLSERSAWLVTNVKRPAIIFPRGETETMSVPLDTFLFDGPQAKQNVHVLCVETPKPNSFCAPLRNKQETSLLQNTGGEIQDISWYE